MDEEGFPIVDGQFHVSSTHPCDRRRQLWLDTGRDVGFGEGLVLDVGLERLGAVAVRRCRQRGDSGERSNEDKRRAYSSPFRS